MINPNAPRPPRIPELLALPDPEADAPLEPLFVPDPAVWAWVDDHFLNSESDLLITDHQELVGANVLFVWTNVELKKRGRHVAGMAELGKPPTHVGDAWVRGAIEQQRREWFGVLPDLMVTLYAPGLARINAVAVAAILDHELRHFAVKVDKDGETVYDPVTERPTYKIVGHDLEEFRGTVAYFGTAWDGGRARMKDAMNDRPFLDLDAVTRAVGPPLMVD